MAVTVTQRKGRTGWYVIAINKGRRHYARFGEKKTALAHARMLEQALAAGKIGLASETAPTLDSYIAEWLAQTVKPFRKLGTYTLYEIQYRTWIKPQLGEIQVSRLSKADIRALVARMSDAGKSTQYIRGTLGMLSSALTRAVDDGLLAQNPCVRALPRARGAETTRVATALAKSQLRQLLDACKTHYPRSYPLVLLWARTGLRLNEALALQWGDIDFERKRISVLRTFAAKGQTLTPKSGKPRVVDLSDQLAKALRSHRPDTAQPGQLIFSTAKGTRISGENFRNRVWRKLFILAGLPYVRIHDLRHTFATRLLEEGEPLAYVQQQLGHGSIRTTVDRYGHLQPGYNKGAVNKLDDEGGEDD